MKLPIAISLPHAGLSCPQELSWYNLLSAEDVHYDHDVGASELYALHDRVCLIASTAIARAYVDVDRAPNDFSPDGVFKAHTRWNCTVYHQPPPPELVRNLIEVYHHRFHHMLSAAAAQAAVGLDCHALHPPSGSLPEPRYMQEACAYVSALEGACPSSWVSALRGELELNLGGPVVQTPVPTNAYTLRAHAYEMPWIRLDIRPRYDALEVQRVGLARALTSWCSRLDGPSRERQNRSWSSSGPESGGPLAVNRAGGTAH